jgi:hypothetical protein
VTTRSCDADVASLLSQERQPGAWLSTESRLSINLSAAGNENETTEQKALRNDAEHARFVPCNTDHWTAASVGATGSMPESPRLIAALRSSMRHISLPRLRLLGSIRSSSPTAGIFDAPGSESEGFASGLHSLSSAAKHKRLADAEATEPRTGAVHYIHRQAINLVAKIKRVQIRPSCFAVQSIDA